MALEGPLLHDGSQTTAAADLSAAANQYRAVKLTAARSVNLASTGGEAIAGILQNTPASGDAADVGFCGFSKARIGAAGCAAADPLMTEAATGKLVTKTSTNVVVAVALEAGAADDIITVRLVSPGG